jgi:hypothetical protein
MDMTNMRTEVGTVYYEHETDYCTRFNQRGTPHLEISSKAQSSCVSTAKLCTASSIGLIPQICLSRNLLTSRTDDMTAYVTTSR